MAHIRVGRFGNVLGGWLVNLGITAIHCISISPTVGACNGTGSSCTALPSSDHGVHCLAVSGMHLLLHGIIVEIIGALQGKLARTARC